MNTSHHRSRRRAFLGTVALAATAFTTRGAFAEELTARRPFINAPRPVRIHPRWLSSQ